MRDIFDGWMADEHKSRYAHLLEPIRDLADNWNIDIARELEDYLHEVRAAKVIFIMTSKD